MAGIQMEPLEFNGIMGNSSENITQVAKALNNVQIGLAAVRKDAKNPFFKSTYADLASIWDAVRIPLTTNGLSIVQCPRVSLVPDLVVLETILLHTSGQWMSSQLVMRPVKSDPQGVGSCITYARRYGMCAILGITVTDEDDDGNAASQVQAK